MYVLANILGVDDCITAYIAWLLWHVFVCWWNVWGTVFNHHSTKSLGDGQSWRTLLFILGKRHSLMASKSEVFRLFGLGGWKMMDMCFITFWLESIFASEPYLLTNYPDILMNTEGTSSWSTCLVRSLDSFHKRRSWLINLPGPCKYPTKMAQRTKFIGSTSIFRWVAGNIRRV